MRPIQYLLLPIAALTMSHGGFASAYDGLVEKKVFTMPTTRPSGVRR